MSNPKGVKRGGRSSGFTLIEVMIVVAIVAILAAVAYPSYQESVRKARRAEAKAALVNAAQQLERLYTQNNSYAGATVGDLGTDTIRDHVPADRPHGDATYLVVLNLPTATTYALTATRAGSQTSDTTCGDYSLTSTGVKSISAGTVAACW